MKKPATPIENIATLWLQLTDIYKARFVNLYGEKDSGVWYLALNDLTEADISFGLEAMTKDSRFETWPPNCTQFRHLCIQRPTLPTVHQAFQEARFNLGFPMPRHWNHPAVKFTVKHLGLHKVNDGRADLAFKAFKELYEKVCQRIALGYEVPAVSDEELVIRPKSSQQTPPRLSLLIR